MTQIGLTCFHVVNILLYKVVLFTFEKLKLFGNCNEIEKSKRGQNLSSKNMIEILEWDVKMKTFYWNTDTIVYNNIRSCSQMKS